LWGGSTWPWESACDLELDPSAERCRGPSCGCDEGCKQRPPCHGGALLVDGGIGVGGSPLTSPRQPTGDIRSFTRTVTCSTAFALAFGRHSTASQCRPRVCSTPRHTRSRSRTHVPGALRPVGRHEHMSSHERVDCSQLSPSVNSHRRCGCSVGWNSMVRAVLGECE
jgi:hypothetical protein